MLDFETEGTYTNPLVAEINIFDRDGLSSGVTAWPRSVF
jgi:hypothetical protein